MKNQTSTTTRNTETGQAFIIFLLAVVAIIVCLSLCYEAVSQLAGTNNLFATMLNGISAAIK